MANGSIRHRRTAFGNFLVVGRLVSAWASGRIPEMAFAVSWMATVRNLVNVSKNGEGCRTWSGDQALGERRDEEYLAETIPVASPTVESSLIQGGERFRNQVARMT